MANLTDYQYDVFISYSSKDGHWVRSWPLPRLEEAGLRISIDRRDFTIGKPALVNMEEAVSLSWQTLLVLSPNWLKSDWTTFEGLLVQTKDPAGVHARMLPLMLTDCVLPNRLAMLTWDDFKDGNRHEAELKRLLAQLQKGHPTKQKPKEPDAVFFNAEMEQLTVEFEATKAELETKTIADEPIV